MAKLTQKFCLICKKDTWHTWTYDKDSEPDEPNFEEVCLSCELNKGNLT